MVRKPVSLNWMHNKYGDSTNPFEVIIMMDNNQGGVDGKWSDSADNNQFRYQYRRQNMNTGKYEYERLPKRTLQILNPHDYRGELGLRKNPFWYNTDKVWMVNGTCQKADGNFLGDFFIKTIADTGITLGSYVLCDADVYKVYEAGCTAVMNIMTE